MLNFERQFLNVKEERDVYTTVAAAEGESNFVWLSKTKFVFFVGIGKCAIVNARCASDIRIHDSNASHI